jgi:hypothetical protein
LLELNGKNIHVYNMHVYNSIVEIYDFGKKTKKTFSVKSYVHTIYQLYIFLIIRT